VAPTVCPGYDEQRAVEAVAALYSWQWIAERATTGSGLEDVKPVPASVGTAVNGLLALDGELPVLELAEAFGSADISAFRRLISDLTAKNVDEDFLADAVSRFNQEVRRYESRQEFARTAELVTLMVSASVAGGGAAPWYLPYLLGFLYLFLRNFASGRVGAIRKWFHRFRSGPRPPVHQWIWSTGCGV
jgi:hypothetical protein